MNRDELMAFLEEHADEMARRERGSAGLFVLMGREIEDRRRAAKKQRRDVVRRFRDFDDPEANARFLELFEER